MTCRCGHEADVHEGRCYAPRCPCERYEEVEERTTGALPADLFPAEGDAGPPLAVIYPSRHGRPWAHVVTVADHPTRPYLTCGCRGFAMRGTCWAVERVSGMIGIPAREKG